MLNYSWLKSFLFQSLLKTADQLKIKGLCEVPEGANTNDMPGAEVTPLPPRPLNTLARAKIRRLSVQAKRRLDTRKRLFRESLQQLKQQVSVKQKHYLFTLQSVSFIIPLNKVY